MLDTDLVYEFEKKFDCRVIIDLFDSNESMYAKLMLGRTNYDVIFPSNYYVELLKNQKMIQPLDLNLIPNRIYLDSAYFPEELNMYAIPYMVSFSGIGYRSDRVKLSSPSYQAFNDKHYRGRITMLNDLREALGACLKTLGYSINTTKASEVREAADLLIKWKQNFAKFENEQNKSGLANGEFLISQIYSPDLSQVQAENENVAFAFPKEGCILAIDCMCIPYSAPQFDLAHAFINFMIAPTVAALNIERTYALTPIIPAYSMLPEDFRHNPILFPAEEQKEKMELIHDIGPHIELYHTEWERVKGS